MPALAATQAVTEREPFDTRFNFDLAYAAADCDAREIGWSEEALARAKARGEVDLVTSIERRIAKLRGVEPVPYVYDTEAARLAAIARIAGRAQRRKRLGYIHGHTTW